MDDISVLIVDDSALMRNLVSRIIDSAKGLSVAGRAMNGQFALEKIPICKPDVIVLDIEMPVMNGVQFLEERRKRGIDIPVVILSSVAQKGAAITMRCLELGASDFITKPSGSVSYDINKVAERLVELVASYGGQYARHHGKITLPEDCIVIPPHFKEAGNAADSSSGNSSLSSSIANSFSSSFSSSVNPSDADVSVKEQQKKADELLLAIRARDNNKQPAVITPLRAGGKIEIIAIGISTGGPNALRDVFRCIDPNLAPPVVVVQHMPAGFTEEFANSLNNICPLEVKEAKDGDLLKKGRILIAPGNKHITVEVRSLAAVVRLNDDELRNGHRPSADVLFESVAKYYQNRALGVIMTGMGRDGAAQLAEMRKQGAWTLGQDQESSIVYGMPKVAWEYGAVQKQVALSEMANAISTVARDHQ